MMRRTLGSALRLRAAARMYSSPAPADGKRYDLFGYEMSSDVGPWNDKISKVQYWNDAGEIVVEMNRANCPPDLSTYKAVLRAILNSKSKFPEPMAGENKFCAMMDTLEEMDHRSGISVDQECWMVVMEECVKSGDFRAGRAVAACMKETYGSEPADLVAKNEANADAAKKDGKEFPAALAKEAGGLFEMEIKSS
eukprot:TRINITY_DN937_c0_g1_i3.p1 TRINITY_DN937_c0_g1~~TRINITY_DN937_c0_g1_i3.p1  ORF type:complete len:221 (+),score=113.56 TRINITY_DN937_c0_g1_i3:80-664(+)